MAEERKPPRGGTRPRVGAHPLVVLIRRSRQYRVLIGGFVARMTGSYGAALAGVWGAWRFGSPARAAWLVASISVASALGALWIGRRHDRGSARPVLRWAGAIEAIACTVLAIGGVRAMPDVVLLGAGALAGVARAVWSAVVTPALADAAGRDRAVGAFGVGWAFDAGKLLGAILVAAFLVWSPALVLVPLTVVVGTILFTHYRIVPHTVGVLSADRPVVAASAVHRATAMIAIASFCLYQQDILFRVAFDVPVLYAIAAGAFAIGAIAATAQLAWNAPGRLPGRRGLIVSVVACAFGTAGLLAASGLLSALCGLVIGWGCAYGWQGCRPVYAWAAQPGLASGWQTAWSTVAVATGAPIAVAVLPHAAPATVLLALSVVLAAAAAPDVHAAAARAANTT